MSLSTRIALALVAVVALFAGLDGFVVQRVFDRRFEALEQHAAAADVARVRAALEAEATMLGELAMGLGTTAAVRGALDHGTCELDAASLEGLDLDLLTILGPAADATSHPVAHAARVGDLAARDFPRGAWSTRHPLVAGTPVRRAGIQQTETGPLLVAVAPVQGPSDSGRLVVGRLLSEARVAELAERIGVEFSLYQLGADADLPPHLERHLPQATASAAGHLEPGEEHALALATVDDLQAQPDLLVAARVPHEITRQGSAATTFGRISVLVGALVLVLALLILLRHMVLRPLERLAAHAEHVGRTEDLTARAHEGRTDELGTLASELDGMLTKLAEARAALIDAARAAGKSEIATGILHNVGNVLSGIGVATEQLQQAVGELPQEDLEAVTRTLEEHATDLAGFFRDDPRAAHLTPFLRALADAQRGARGRMGSELGDLRRGLDHVAQLVRDQQRFAQQGGLVETHDARALANEALSLVDRSGTGAGPAVAVEACGDLPSVQVDRHRVLEIVVNLIQNAQQATEDSGAVRVVLERVEQGLALDVVDTGRGIPAEELTRIFAPGYTTRPEGHGFGLHTAANAAREMGATLTATSKGLGHGARFRLLLPLTRTIRESEASASHHLAA